MVHKAKNGDTAAAKLVYSYAVGRTAAPVEPDTLDQKELAVFAGNHVGVEEYARIARLFPVGAMVAMLRAAMPFLEEGKSMEMKSLLEKAAARVDRKMKRRDEEIVEEIEELLSEPEAGADESAANEPAPAADPAAKVKELEAEVARRQKHAEELKAQYHMRQPQSAPVGVPNRLEPFLGDDEAAPEQRRRDQEHRREAGGGPGEAEPSPIGSNGVLHHEHGNGKGYGPSPNGANGHGPEPASHLPWFAASLMTPCYPAGHAGARLEPSAGAAVSNRFKRRGARRTRQRCLACLPSLPRQAASGDCPSRPQRAHFFYL